MQFTGRSVALDTSAGIWLAESAASATPATVAALVPSSFEAVARVFHPAVRYVGDDDVEVPWASVAAANGTTVHPLMQWGSVTGAMEYFENDDQSPLWHGAPARGHLPAPVAERLVSVLSRWTTTPDVCWFAVAQGGAVITDHPTLSLPDREYWLINGPVQLAAQNMAAEPFEQSANLWWPADRAWCVVTDIDLVSTYVGGSAACIAELFAVDGLEIAPAEFGQRTTWDADRVNPTPPDAPDR
ncbi:MULTISPECIES: hypothetical protein [unclassified Modestobacter]|uniref:hypothetical protein n=1 Tax=unclassified Modestobacter TaxID=2643866 RepID=UPI0022AA541C|nr:MULTISPECIES: hypothetical protein [unclassified Modestobacter]MCZ2823504.1 hypothetical protein [Modestobacter sp. VKM Ac-2981]MCZ2851749.1 hypothetical protein [Modestobacter sp. VKM Ac-2982]